MLSLRQFRSKRAGLNDLLNWASLIDDGIVQGKDGSLIAGWFYRGSDIASSSDEERNSLCLRINRALARLGTGWSYWIEALRIDAVGYPPPEASHFPDPISRLIDDERRAQFEAEGRHFESEYGLVVQFTPPLRRRSQVTDLLYDAQPGATKTSLADRILEQFKRDLDLIEDTLGDALHVRRMRGFLITDPVDESEHLSDELVNFLAFTLTHEVTALKIPRAGGYLDTLLPLRDFYTGDILLHGESYIACVEINGWPEESFPQILDTLNHLEFPYRWSTRFIALDTQEAIVEIRKLHRKWKQKVRGFMAQLFQTKGGLVNEDALLMTSQAQDSISLAESGQVAFGFHTCVVVVMDGDPVRLMDNARAVARAIRHCNFTAEVSSVNTKEAWFGSLPGHPIPNVLRPLQHTDTLSHVMPSSSVWSGDPIHPNPMYPENSPPLLIAKTTGSTPFRISLHSHDNGHALVFGPVGSGKTTLAATTIAQSRRYAGATGFALEKGKNLQTIVRACGGLYYDIGGDNSPAFCPLGVLESETDFAWAQEWIEFCYALQHSRPPSPTERDDIYRAMLLQRESPIRTITNFIALVQNETVREAMRPYSIMGALGNLYDGEADGMATADLVGGDIGNLMVMRDAASLPLLLYLFRRFERQLHGQPAFLWLDEAWLLFRNAFARPKLVELAKGLRKLVCSMTLLTQSLSDAARSEMLDVLLESCPSVIYGANPQAEVTGTDDHPGPRDFYAALGRGATEIAIIKHLIPKRQYYLTSPQGNRVFELGLGPAALAFVAVGSPEEIAAVEALERRYGEEWPFVWLHQKGVIYDHALREAAE